MVQELKDIKRKDIPYKVRLEIALKTRAYKDAASKIKNDSSVEAFNNHDLRREPDSVGVTVYYPNKEAPTHFMTKVFPITVGEKAFEKEVQRMEKELLKKAKAKDE